MLPRVAVVVDVRGRDLFADLPEAIRALREGRQIRVMFLDASDEVLVRRFEAVRRPHPLQGDGTILDGIRLERERLAPLRETRRRHHRHVVDTTSTSSRPRSQSCSRTTRSPATPLTLLSFGFKYGLPPDADLVADMRFLPNPFWNEELRPLTGEDEAVREYVLAQRVHASSSTRTPRRCIRCSTGYQRENKRHSVVAIGCTGGKHRSVVMVRELADRLAAEPGVAVRREASRPRPRIAQRPE